MSESPLAGGYVDQNMKTRVVQQRKKKRTKHNKAKVFKQSKTAKNEHMFCFSFKAYTTREGINNMCCAKQANKKHMSKMQTTYKQTNKE